MNNLTPDSALNYLLSLERDELFENFSLRGQALEEYKRLLQAFEESNSSAQTSTRDKGQSLESLVLFIATKTNLFEVIPNVRTSSNEIDLLLRSKPQSIPLLEKFVSPDLKNIIIECKNYSGKISVTWIGKLYSLLKYQRCTVGIIFSYKGFTGQSWTAGVGLSKKIHLLDKTSIIDFNIEDFKKMVEGYNFISILENKLANLQQEVEIECKPHPAEKYMQNF